MNDKIKQFKQTYEEEQAKLQKLGEEQFKEISQDFFNKYPTLENFSWNQYTPYFCDGDLCEFGVNSYSLAVNGSSEFDDDFIEKKKDKEFNKIHKELTKFVGSFPEEILKNIFGDHAEIIVTREGIEVSSYEHD